MIEWDDNDPVRQRIFTAAINEMIEVERRIKVESKPIVDRYLEGEITFDEFVAMLVEIDDAKIAEEVAAEFDMEKSDG